MTSARPLDAFFRPKSIAVIGGTSAALANLQACFPGKLYTVDPARPEIPARVDLVIIDIGEQTTPALVTICGEAQVKAILILNAAALEDEALQRARALGIRILGPGCLGVMNPHYAMNATFAHAMALEGSVALISQSGALCSAILDWSLREHVGFSAFVSTGSLLNVGWGELIQYFGNDNTTRSMVLYMESGDGRKGLRLGGEKLP